MTRNAKDGGPAAVYLNCWSCDEPLPHPGDGSHMIILSELRGDVIPCICGASNKVPAKYKKYR